MTTEELLLQMEAEAAAYEEITPVCSIDPDTRVITIPPELSVFGVESDENAERLPFRCPKIVGDNIDLTQLQIRINFQNAKGGEEGKDQYIVTDVAEENDYITFSWVFSKKAVAYKGKTSFIVCAVKIKADGVIENHWNTTLASGTVLEGMEVDYPEPGEEEKDVIAQLLGIANAASYEAVQAAADAMNAAAGIIADRKQIQKNADDISLLDETLDSHIKNQPLDTVDVNDISMWERHCLSSTGEYVGDTNNIRWQRLSTKYPINAKDLSVVESSNGFEFLIACYNADGLVSDAGTTAGRNNAFLDIPNKRFTNAATYYTHVDIKDILDIIGEYHYIRFTVKKGNEVLTIDKFSNIKIIMPKMPYPYIFDDNGIVIENPINENHDIWNMWNKRLTLGLDKTMTRVPVKVNGPIFADGTLILHNNGDKNTSAWGEHVLQAYDSANYARVTLLVNKHRLWDKRVTSLYYYAGDWNHGEAQYFWVQLGSDVKEHSFYFGRDKMTALGEIDAKVLITLPRINTLSDLDSAYATINEADNAYEPESKSSENLACVKYLALKNAENGAMFYDTIRNKVVVKVNGKWCDMQTTEVPEGTYDF